MRSQEVPQQRRLPAEVHSTGIANAALLLVHRSAVAAETRFSLEGLAALSALERSLLRVVLEVELELGAIVESSLTSGLGAVQQFCDFLSLPRCFLLFRHRRCAVGSRGKLEGKFVLASAARLHREVVRVIVVVVVVVVLDLHVRECIVGRFQRSPAVLVVEVARLLLDESFFREQSLKVLLDLIRFGGELVELVALLQAAAADDVEGGRGGAVD